MSQTLLVTVTGPDRPGVTTRLLAALSTAAFPVVDIEQIVVRGQLVLSLLLSTEGASEEQCQLAKDAVCAAATELNLHCEIQSGAAEQDDRRRGRLIVTVIGNPLDPGELAAIAAAVAETGGNIDRIVRVACRPVTAIELEVSGADLARLRVNLTSVAVDVGVDLSVQQPGLARRGARLVVMDVDSTLIQDEVIELIAAHAGCADQVAEVTERAMAGEIDFAESLAERVALLKGVPESALTQVGQQVRLTPGARTLCRTLNNLGYQIALVSGGFHEVVDPIAHELGIDHVRANRLEIVDGLLTGRTIGPVVDRAGKAAALDEFAAVHGVSLERTVAIGDGANDLDMLARAGLGIAFNAKPVVRAQADVAVNVPYLDTVLFLLGIPREEIELADAASPS
ncbi:MAG: phosphoserine phosphatase SerB [Candidatus Nanopelagicales bacterium]|nr:phosphoserine phosphatase SerB [Candidatus Nanopelagicales bacterium]